MKNIFKKQNILPIAVLSVICIVVALLLGLVNSFTAKEIEKQMLIASNAGKIEVLPGLDVTTMEEITPDGDKYPAEVKKISKFDIGYVVETEVKGNATGMVVLVGIDNEGKITGVKVLKNGETPSFWANVESVVTGPDGKYNGQTPDTLQPELVGGATNSSNGVYSAVKTSLDAFVILGGGEVEKEQYNPPVSQREDSALLTLADELVADAAGFEFVDFDAEAYEAKYLARLMKEKGGKGYVAYLVVINERYARVETETLIRIGNDGSIKDIKKLVWKTSDAGWGYEPPAMDVVDPFYASLVGKMIADLEALLALEENDGQLVTNATSTSKGLLTALIEGVKIANDIRNKDMPRPEEEVIGLAKDMIGAGAELTDVTPEEKTFVKRIYRENKGKGYIAYLVVVNEKYARIETETLIHVGNDGKIKNINKLIWKTSDAGWGYEPPTDDAVDPFYASLVGKNLSDLEALLALEENDGQLVTNATSTSKGLITALVEGVTVIEGLRKKDMPRPEEEVISLAQQMAGEGKTLVNVTVGGVEFLKRLYRIDSTNGYIAYLVVYNDRYGRVETETMIYIDEDGSLKEINKLTWKTSDAGWGYEPPTDDAVEPFYASLVGKNLSDLEALLSLETNDGQLVTNATSTSKGLITALVEAVKAADSIKLEPEHEPEDNTPKVIGVAIICVMVALIASAVIVPKVIRRRKNG